MDKDLEGVQVTTIDEEEVIRLARETGADEQDIRDFLSGKIPFLVIQQDE